MSTPTYQTLPEWMYRLIDWRPTAKTLTDAQRVVGRPIGSSARDTTFNVPRFLVVPFRSGSRFVKGLTGSGQCTGFSLQYTLPTRGGPHLRLSPQDCRRKRLLLLQTFHCNRLSIKVSRTLLFLMHSFWYRSTLLHRSDTRWPPVTTNKQADETWCLRLRVFKFCNRPDFDGTSPPPCYCGSEVWKDHKVVFVKEAERSHLKEYTNDLARPLVPQVLYPTRLFSKTCRG